MTLDRFYPIFDSADWIERLVPLGIKLVQLRMKDTSPDVVTAHIERSKLVCARHGCTLIVNDYWQAAIDTRCDFIHLGQEDLDDADIAAIRAAGLRFGISTHDKTELRRALARRPFTRRRPRRSAVLSSSRVSSVLSQSLSLMVTGSTCTPWRFTSCTSCEAE